MHTPWGSTDYQKTIAPGIIQVSTPSHGGYYLDELRCKEVEACFGGPIKCWAGRGWLEEDCDWCFAPLTWPELFSPQQVYNAVRTLRLWHQEVPEAWFETAHGRHVLAIADSYEATIRECWEAGGMFSSPRGYPDRSWGVLITKRGTRKAVIFPEYPTKQFYTDAEMAVLQEVPD